MSGAEADFMAADAPANQIHTVSRLPFARFGRKTASIVRKNIFYCPKRTKSDKKQTENKFFPGVASF